MLEYPELSVAQNVDFEDRISAFETAWTSHRTAPVIAEFLPTNDPKYRLVVLCELIVVDREFRQHRRLPEQDYAQLFPRDATDPLFQAALTHDEPSPPQLGRYERGTLLGRGAYGRVFRGWDNLLKRPVAIKIPHQIAILTESDSERFQREARYAADLHHPHMVTLYDVGREGDTPYLVYEFVEGQTLAEYRQEHTIEVRQAAELIALLAEAVAEAHRHNIIHRDLKPANVLLPGGQLMKAKIADFGSARRTTEATITQSRDLQGTPAYMSPEQARGSRAIDGRADVYALGVMLYEMLVGELPFRGEQVMVLRQIVEDEPTPPRRLNSAVPTDLNTIVLMCLHKEPALRYATAADFAADVRRWLSGQPIKARPLGYIGRFTRWVKREPRVAAAVISLILVLVMSLTTVTLLYLHAREQSRAAERGRREAMEVIDTYLTKVAESKLLNRPGLQPLRKELVEEALARYRQLLQHHSDHPDVLAEMARGWYRVGYLTYVMGSEREAIAAFDQARTLQERLVRTEPSTQQQADLASTYHFLGYIASRFGERETALRWLEQARQLQEPLARDSSEPMFKIEYAGTLRGIARAHIDYGDPQMGLPMLAQADAILAPLGNTKDVASIRTIIHYERMTSLRSQGHVREALTALQQAQAILNAATEETLPRTRQTASFFLTDFERERWQGNIDNGFGLLYMGTQELSKAQQAFSQAATRRELLANQNPTVTGYQAEHASALMNLSMVEELQGNLKKALERREWAAQQYRELVTLNPELFHLRDTVSYVHHSLAEAYLREQRPDDALRTYSHLRDLWSKVAAKSPLERLSLAEANHKAAQLSEQQGRPQPALRAEAKQQWAELRTLLNKQRATQQAALAEQPSAGSVRYDLSLTLEQLSAVEMGLDNLPQAIRLAEERLALWTQNPREQMRAATTWVRYALAAQRSTTTGDDAIAAAITAGFDDLGWLRMESRRYPILDRPSFREQLARLTKSKS